MGVAVESIVSALRDALSEIREHNSEYGHRTTDAKIKQYEQALLRFKLELHSPGEMQ